MFRKFASYHSTFGKATAFAGGALLAGVGSVLYQNTPSAFALPQVHMASPGKQNERTYIMVKPDGVQRNLCGEIMKRFEQKGFKLVACKFVQPTETLLKQHYYDLRARPFYNGLVKYMASGPVLCMVWEGTGVVKMGRKMLGETNPADSLPGSIRGDYCIEIGRNICHGSDAVDSAEKEISLWFTPSELVEWKSTNSKWVLE